MHNIARLHSIYKTFGDQTILADLSAEFKQGVTYAITGASGSGKSTMMHILATLDAPDRGSVYYNERDLHACSAQEKNLFLNQTIGLVFQNPHLIRELSVIENVMIPGLIAGASWHTVRAHALELLHAVGLAQYADAQPMALSGGQLQRVALARALCNKPAFLFADEPTGNLDTHMSKEIVSLLLELQKKWGMGLVISTHDEQVARAMEVTMILHNGVLR